MNETDRTALSRPYEGKSEGSVKIRDGHRRNGDDRSVEIPSIHQIVGSIWTEYPEGPELGGEKWGKDLEGLRAVTPTETRCRNSGTVRGCQNANMTNS